MLTRRELEGQLRTVHPLREQAMRRRQSMARVRRWFRVGLISVLGIMIVVLALLTISSHRVAQSPARRDAEWGIEHVNGYGKPKHQPVFGRSRRSSSGGILGSQRPRQRRWNFAH